LDTFLIDFIALSLVILLIDEGAVDHNDPVLDMHFYKEKIQQGRA